MQNSVLGVRMCPKQMSSSKTAHSIRKINFISELQIMHLLDSQYHYSHKEKEPEQKFRGKYMN
jgi:hypothetical protein